MPKQDRLASQVSHTHQRRSKALRLFWMSDANSAHTERWVRELSERGHQVLLFSLVRPRDERFAKLPGVRVETAGISNQIAYAADGSVRKLVYLRSIPHIRRIVRSYRPHLTHAHYASSYGVLAALAGLRPRIVSVWGADIYRTAELSSIHRAAISLAIRSAECVLSTSWTMRERALELCRRTIDVVPFGIDIERFVPVERIDCKDARITIGTVKSLEHKYGIEYLIRAFALLRRRNPALDLRLLIAGSGSQYEALQRITVELGLQDMTEFAGSVPYADVHRMHQQLDIAVYPSVEQSESFGVSVIESQSCGLPVIVSRIGGLQEVVEEGVTAMVTAPRDVDGLTAAMQRMIDDRNVAREMGRAGRLRVARMYDLKVCATRLEQHYDQLALPAP